jgi:glycosyltransferase involved in cell wall biosynthesis
MANQQENSMHLKDATKAPAGDFAPEAPPVVLLLGPACHAMSGVSTHLAMLRHSPLAQAFDLRHFQVGSEGRTESGWRRLARLLLSPVALAGRILRERVAVVHINTSLNRKAFWRDLAYLLTAKLCGARVLYQVHGGSLPRQFCLEQRLPAPLLRAILQLPDGVVLLARCELKAYGEFVPDLRVSVIPNGIDFQLYCDVDRNISTEASRLRLLYIGRLDREKGLLELFDALQRAGRQGVKLQLQVAGGGPDEAFLKAQVERLGLGKVVRFSGPVFNEAKLALLAAADVFVLPSWSEGLPYALLEAMAAGLPVIATRVGAIPDVMTDKVHGVLVPVRDAPAIAAAIVWLAGDRQALEAMRPACRRRIARSYSRNMLVEQFGRLYRELACTPPASVLGKS